MFIYLALGEFHGPAVGLDVENGTGLSSEPHNSRHTRQFIDAPNHRVRALALSRGERAAGRKKKSTHASLGALHEYSRLGGISVSHHRLLSARGILFTLSFSLTSTS